MVPVIEARGWKALGQLAGGLTDKRQIIAWYKRRQIVIARDGRTPFVLVEVVKAACQKAYRKAISR